MAYKRRYKRTKRSTRKMRRSRRIGKKNMKTGPEVKFSTETSIAPKDVYNMKPSTAVTNLLNSNVNQLTIYPAQGLKDTERIGDTIFVKKLWVRIRIASTLSTYVSGNIRIIIFSLPVAIPSPITNFWQIATFWPAELGKINREVVHRVYYDKVHKIGADSGTGTGGTISGATTRKPLNINIRMNRRVVFSAAGNTPKQPKDILWLAYMASDPNAADNTSVYKLDYVSTLYYSDG